MSENVRKRIKEKPVWYKHRKIVKSLDKVVIANAEYLPKSAFHYEKDCLCIENFLLAREQTILVYYHASPRELEKLYYELLQLVRLTKLCKRAKEYQQIVDFVALRGKAFTKRGLNDNTMAVSNPKIEIKLPSPREFLDLPNKIHKNAKKRIL